MLEEMLALIDESIEARLFPLSWKMIESGWFGDMTDSVRNKSSQSGVSQASCQVKRASWEVPACQSS